jgi:ribosomal protein S18 acetylase RimI-like enzyme
LGSLTTTSRKIELRPLEIGDYQKMIECWRGSELQIRTKGRDSRESIEKQMQKDGLQFTGAFDGEKLVGIAIASYDGRRGWINRLAILPQYRRRGLASALISKAENFLKSKGAKVIAALISSANTQSRRLFEKNGYQNMEDILYYSKRESPEA